HSSAGEPRGGNERHVWNSDQTPGELEHAAFTRHQAQFVFRDVVSEPAGDLDGDDRLFVTLRLLHQDAIDQFTEALFAGVNRQQIVLGCRSGDRIATDPPERNRTKSLGEIGNGEIRFADNRGHVNSRINAPYQRNTSSQLYLGMRGVRHLQDQFEYRRCASWRII